MTIKIGHHLKINRQAEKKLEKISESKVENNRNCKGFNFFYKTDLMILLAILSGEFNICGFRNRQLKQMLNLTSARMSRILKRLRVHGLIKKVKNSYRYCLTKPGKETVIMAQKIKEPVIVTAFNS